MKAFTIIGFLSLTAFAEAGTFQCPAGEKILKEQEALKEQELLSHSTVLFTHEGIDFSGPEIQSPSSALDFKKLVLISYGKDKGTYIDCLYEDHTGNIIKFSGFTQKTDCKIIGKQESMDKWDKNKVTMECSVPETCKIECPVGKLNSATTPFSSPTFKDKQKTPKKIFPPDVKLLEKQ
jgi:hypothetical protein